MSADILEELRDHGPGGVIEYHQCGALLNAYADKCRRAALEIERLRAALNGDVVREALILARDCVLESFEHVKTMDDQVMADARLQCIERALASPPIPQEPRDDR